MRSLVNNPASSAVNLSKADREFRQWLQQYGLWSDTAERLFLHLAHTQKLPIPVTQKQRQTLRLVVEAALNGVNIVERYPAFFRDLLNNVSLRHEFLDMVNQS